jgi:N-methylhydantoinase B
MNEMRGAQDAIDRELVRTGLESVVDEMALTVVRTSYSGTLRDVMDFSTAMLDPKGEMLAQGLTLPLHLGAFPEAMASILAKYGHDLADGDVFIMNDPYAGGMHLPDVFIIKPVFLDGRLLGFPATVGHQADVGGRVPGGNACDSTEIYQEGLRIGPTRLVHRGLENETLVDLIGRNVRLPNRVLGDLRAQLAALHVGEQELVRLARRFGPDHLLRHAGDLVAHSERMVREEIAAWPDGVYAFTDWIDDDGITLDEPIRVSVTATIRGDEMTIDFAGTSPQVASAINSTMASSRSAAWLAVRALMSPDIPNNSGMFRPIRVIAPAGTLVNPKLPAPVAARALTCFRIVDAVMGALAGAAPGRVFAAGEGGISVVTIAGEHDGEPFLIMDTVGCCWGGRPDRDGVEGVTPIALNVSNIPVEIIERDLPLRIEHYGFAADSAGAGRFRGGLALERAYRLLAEKAFLQVRSDRRRFLPYGLAGGGPGAPSLTQLRREGQEHETMPTKITTEFRRGEMVVHRHAGGGGWGDPFEREPERVADDVRDGKLSAAAAAERYGVALDPQTFVVDPARTHERRSGGKT